jgi:hypothetical protein
VAEFKLRHCFVQVVQLMGSLLDASELRACVGGRARLSMVLMSFFGADKAVREYACSTLLVCLRHVECMSRSACGKSSLWSVERVCNVVCAPSSVHVDIRVLYPLSLGVLRQ